MSLKHEFKSSQLVLSPEETQKASQIRNKIIEKKKKEFMKCGEEILELNKSISTISSKLKQKRSDEKDSRVSTLHHISHKKSLELDRTKRPADRDFEIRSYTKMDGDIWRYDQVRNWFNTYATEQEPYNYVPSKEGYTLKVDTAL